MKKNLLKLSTLSLFVLMFASFAFASDPNTDCEDIGMTLVAKYEWNGTGYAFEKPAGNEGVVTITGDTVSGSWTSTQWISAVIIKGGKPPLGSHNYSYDPAVMSGNFSKYDIPLDNYPAISNIQFCVGDVLNFGDAPDPTYPTYLANNGARHTIIPGLFLGASVDPETDGQPTSEADGDDNDGNDDEDGIVATSLIVQGQTAYVDVTASAMCDSVNCYLDAWVDFNGDGDWNDAGEQIFASQLLTAGVNNLQFNVPSGNYGYTFSRWRLSTAGGLGTTGLANDGEVTDEKVAIHECGDDNDCFNDQICIIPETFTGSPTGMIIGFEGIQVCFDTPPVPIPEFTTVGIIVALLGVAMVYLLLIRKRK
ncbi:hypothetical protein KY331_03835 [Candidatus Woesearchaeota archaeon]|nr:hypothetical protein [Candidatus Woesearchaeota archaeon]